MEISLVLGTIAVRDQMNRHSTAAEWNLRPREHRPRPAGPTTLPRVVATARVAVKRLIAGARRLEAAEAAPGGPGLELSA